jgi:hypothetical protein
MQRAEFIKLIGAKSDSGDYIPVACLLRNGYACAGFVNQSINEQYTDVCILVNARMVDLREPNRRTERGAVHDFGDFLEEFVVGMMKKKKKGADLLDADQDPIQERFGKSIPLTAVAFDEIAIVYPVARIGNLLNQMNVETKADLEKVPTFMDFENNSLLIKILKTKLW